VGGYDRYLEPGRRGRLQEYEKRFMEEPLEDFLKERGGVANRGGKGRDSQETKGRKKRGLELREEAKKNPKSLLEKWNRA